MTNEWKDFDAVELMRETREKLSVKYWQHPDVLKHDMEEIGKKYSSIERENDQSCEEVVTKR